MGMAGINTSAPILIYQMQDSDSLLCSTGYSLITTVSYIIYVFSQSLVNLLVTGHAVSNVWDGDRECSGMSEAAKKLTAHAHIQYMIYAYKRHMFINHLQTTDNSVALLHWHDCKQYMHPTVIMLTSNRNVQKEPI